MHLYEIKIEVLHWSMLSYIPLKYVYNNYIYIYIIHAHLHIIWITFIYCLQKLSVFNILKIPTTDTNNSSSLCVKYQTLKHTRHRCPNACFDNVLRWNVHSFICLQHKR